MKAAEGAGSTDWGDQYMRMAMRFDTRPAPSADDKEARKAFHLAEIARSLKDRPRQPERFEAVEATTAANRQFSLIL